MAMKCDLCGNSENLIQLCAFGHFGELHLHPQCQQRLRSWIEKQQDKIIARIRKTDL
jgi:hypothetical protein